MSTALAEQDRPVTILLEGPRREWPKRVLAAWLRMMGATQRDAGSAVGRSESTVKHWEGDESWPQAVAEAKVVWHEQSMDYASRRAILKSVRGGNADLAFKYLERVDARMAPPKVRQELSGPDGGPIEIRPVREKVGEQLGRVRGNLTAIPAAEFEVLSNGNGTHGNGAHG